MLADWVKEDGKLAIHALIGSSRTFACDFNLFFIATSAMAVIAGRYGKYSVFERTAKFQKLGRLQSVAAMPKLRLPPTVGGYVVNVRATAKGNDRIVLKVALPTSRDYFSR